MAQPSPMLAGQYPQQQRHLTLDRRKNITFMGRSFYLDLPPSKHSQHLAKAIGKLGGVIESFLSRDVNYVVTDSRRVLDTTNGCSVGARKGGRSKRQAAENIEPALCRGKQLLKKVVQKQECSSVVTSARSWGVCILHVDEVLKYLERTQGTSNTTEGRNSVCTRQPVKVVSLKKPFLKIEDQSRKYRPLQYCFSRFPEVSFLPSGRSPFDVACTNASSNKEKNPGDQEDAGSERSRRPQAWEKRGYCECCQVNYTKLSEHLFSEQHSRFALDPSNYKVIDEIACHITCNLMEWPHGFKAASKGDVGLISCNEDESKLGMPEDCREHGAETSKDEVKLDLPVDRCMANDGSEQNEIDSEVGLPVTKALLSPQRDIMEVAAEIPPPYVEDVNYVQNQCKEPLQVNCDAEVASHVGVVTEVSWYTEETGLTSIYTVQSLIVPPDGQATDLTLVNTLENVKPPRLLNPVENTLGAPVTECLTKAHSSPGLSVPGAPIKAEVYNATGSHYNDGLAAEASSVSLCSFHFLDAQGPLPTWDAKPENAGELPLNALTLHEPVLSDVQHEPALNVPERLNTEMGITLSPHQLNMMSVFKGPVVTSLIDPLASDTSKQEQDQMHTIPLYHGPTAIPVVLTSLTHVVNGSNTDRDQLNIKPLQHQDPVETSTPMTSVTHVVNGSNTDEDQLNRMTQYHQDSVSTPTVIASITHIANGSSTDKNLLKIKPLQCQDSLDTLPVMNSIAHEVSGIGTGKDELNTMPLQHQNTIDTPAVMTSNAHVVNGSNGDRNVPLYQDMLDAPVVMPVVAPQYSDGNPEDQSQFCHSPVNTLAMAHSTAALTHQNCDPMQEQQLSATDSHNGKRKHRWSQCFPPAKRLPNLCHQVPLPMLFNQFPDTRLQLAAQLMEGQSSSATKEKAVSRPRSYFNPKIIQYNASSESDWDSGLLSQQQDNHPQNARYGDLCTAQVNLDDSWYGRQLCSVLAHDQTLGSSSAAQTVTLAHATCDVYLSGVAS